MTVIIESGYSLPGADQPLTHARIAHSGNWLSGTPAASGTATGYFADAPNNSLTYEYWKPDALPGTWDLEFYASADVDYCAIAAHNMGANGNTLRVQRYDSGAWSNMIPATAVADDSPIFCIFTKTADTKYRVRISGGTAPTIGVIRFGVAMQMPQAIYGGHAPSHLGREAVMRANISETGEFLGRTRQRAHVPFSASWAHLTAAWVRSTWRPFQIAAETEPFFIAWRPLDYSEAFYGQMTNSPKPQNMGIRDYMQVSLDATGRAYD